ncbi:MAG: hypothetical protein NWQ13_06380 [Glaciimonas sp.]|nr:hypothetical protein [Glaciimonas sp.]
MKINSNLARIFSISALVLTSFAASNSAHANDVQTYNCHTIWSNGLTDDLVFTTSQSAEYIENFLLKTGNQHQGTTVISAKCTPA